MINSLVLTPVMIIALIGTGVYLSIITKFLQFRKFKIMIKATIGSSFKNKPKEIHKNGVNPFQAVSTALAGTLGTGSIAGVATAITAGGPGAVFWMWVSAILGMVTKYAEILLSVKFKEKNNKGKWTGGPMYYIKNGMKNKGLAIFFAITSLIACMGIGNAVQSNAIANALNNSTLKVSTEMTGIILTIAVSGVIIGGIKRIASANEKLVPFMAMFYIVFSLLVLIINIYRIPSIFVTIFREALKFRSVIGGGSGYCIMSAIKNGFSKGIFSNEAGLGSAPIAHGATYTQNAVEQGLWGMFEVFFTTIVICTMSALVILSTGIWEIGEIYGSALCIASFNESFPGIGETVVTTSTILFSLSTILGWAYYGEVSIKFLFKKSEFAILIYRIIYIIVVYISAISSFHVIWNLSEIMNTFMALPNLIAVISLRKVILKTTNDYFKK